METDPNIVAIGKHVKETGDQFGRDSLGSLREKGQGAKDLKSFELAHAGEAQQSQLDMQAAQVAHTKATLQQETIEQSIPKVSPLLSTNNERRPFGYSLQRFFDNANHSLGQLKDRFVQRISSRRAGPPKTV